jgi:hypothetical protein
MMGAAVRLLCGIGSMLWLASCAFPRPADVGDDGNGNDDLCGNGVTDSNAGEQCESEGNDSQACNGKTAGAVACHVPACGDGYTNIRFNPDGAHAEECDNLGGGNTQACNGNNGGTNSAGSCRQPRCGNGYTNEQFKPDGLHPEECDVGTSDTSACNGSNAPSAVQCQRAECGDGYINAQFKPDGAHAEQCDNLGGRNTRPATATMAVTTVQVAVCNRSAATATRTTSSSRTGSIPSSATAAPQATPARATAARPQSPFGASQRSAETTTTTRRLRSVTVGHRTLQSVMAILPARPAASRRSATTVTSTGWLVNSAK